MLFMRPTNLINAHRLIEISVFFFITDSPFQDNNILPTSYIIRSKFGKKILGGPAQRLDYGENIYDVSIYLEYTLDLL